MYFGQIIVKSTQFDPNWVLFFRKWYTDGWEIWQKKWYRDSQIFEVRQAHPRTILVKEPPPPPGYHVVQVGPGSRFNVLILNVHSTKYSHRLWGLNRFWILAYYLYIMFVSPCVPAYPLSFIRTIFVSFGTPTNYWNVESCLTTKSLRLLLKLYG